ncbi:MAG: hypothetical protein WBP81_18235 [Solirubrobacteraceae bacterium]
MLVRPNRVEISFRRRRQGQDRSASRQLAPQSDTETTLKRAPGRHAREEIPPEDRAVYACQCGFVFGAPVSTTVACPECGQGQAW